MVLSQHLPARTGETTRDVSRVVDVPAKIRTEQFPNGVKSVTTTGIRSVLAIVVIIKFFIYLRAQLYSQ
jgi:hypothetical protein